MTEQTRFDLTISSTDGLNSSASVSTNDLDDVLRLLQLAGQDGGSRRFSATVSHTGLDPAENATMSVNSNNQDDVLRLMQLAGVVEIDSKSCGCPGPCNCASEPEKPCGCAGPCDCMMSASSVVAQPPVAVMEQQAQHDYGHDDPTKEGHEFDIKDYNFKGRADLPERLTSARYGSNPLKSEMRESAFLRLKAQYQAYLEESRENEAGLSSPLTANERDEFEHDPLADEEPVTDGSRSPLSRIERQKLPT